MSHLVTLVTPRLTLYCLDQDSLRLGWESAENLAGALGLTVPEGSISDASRRAMAVKLARMDAAPLRSHPWYTYWLVVLTAQDVAVGMMGFKGAPDFSGVVEVGYGLNPAYHNFGYATEALQTIAAWAFSPEHPYVRAIIAETLVENLSSQRVLQKNGFLLQGEANGMRFWRLNRPQVSP